ncbi:hypothetical protein K2X40_00115 [Candidatus Babeliales bacterium]|nr:hypothetical protein [Candidatus Babeliales bacterium]
MKCVAIVTLFLLSFGNVFAASSSHSISDSDATLHRRTPIGSSPRIKLADLRKQETAEINLFLAFGLINTFFNEQLDRLLSNHPSLVRMRMCYGIFQKQYTLYQWAFECNNRQAMSIILSCEEFLDSIDRDEDRDEIIFDRPRSRSL